VKDSKQTRNVDQCQGCGVLKPAVVNGIVVCLRTEATKSLLPHQRPRWCPLWPDHYRKDSK
jgi:hypothetical protein